MSTIFSNRSLSYRGTEADQPPNWFINTRNPTSKDIRNVTLGDLWLNKTTKSAWILVSLARTIPSQPVLVADWLQITNNFIETLVGNNIAVTVYPDGSDNINLKGDGTSINIVGSGHTLTLSAIAADIVETWTGNSGGAVSPSLTNNINLIGDGTTIKFTGNPLTHTLTASVVNPLDFTITGNSGGPVLPTLAGNINLVGDGVTIDIVGNPGDNTLTMSLIPAEIPDTLTGDSGGAVSPGAGNNINLVGSSGITVVGTPGTHTLTVEGGSSLALTFDADAGSASPIGGILDIGGSTNIVTSGSGSTITVSTAGSLDFTNLTVENLTVTTSADFSYLTQGVVQSNGSGSIFSSEGTNGQTLISSSAGVPLWNTITAGANISIANGTNSIMISEGSGGVSGLVFIANGAQVYTSIPTTFKTLLLVGNIISTIPSTVGVDEAVYVTLSSNNGSSYYSSYLSGLNITSTNGPSTVANINTTSGLICGFNYNVGAGIQSALSFALYIYNVNNTSTPIMSSTSSSTLVGTIRNYQGSGSGICTSSISGPINALLVNFSSIATVAFSTTLYGIAG